jgi:hypothetical protein
MPDCRIGFLRSLPATIGAAALVSAIAFPSTASAESTIRYPGRHPKYTVELEPHLLFSPYDPPGWDHGGTGWGAGMRATIPIVENGFVQSINNSVGISFGLDWIHYGGESATYGYCSRYVPAPDGRRVCVEVANGAGGPSNYFYFPVAMQWNFWLADKFSAFGEPGLAIYYAKSSYSSYHKISAVPVFELGGRWHFVDWAALTFRLGYPSFSLGVSFFL